MNTNPHYDKSCIMIVQMHDIAFPKPIKTGLFGIGGMSIPRRPQDIQIYAHLTMEFVRESSNEALGSFIKSILKKVDETKDKIES